MEPLIVTAMFVLLAVGAYLIGRHDGEKHGQG